MSSLKSLLRPEILVPFALADAAIAACFSGARKQLAYFVAHPEKVTPEDIAAACGAAGSARAARGGTPGRAW